MKDRGEEEVEFSFFFFSFVRHSTFHSPLLVLPPSTARSLTTLAPRTSPDLASACSRSLGGSELRCASNSPVLPFPFPPMAACRCFPVRLLPLLPSSPGARGCTLRGSNGPFGFDVVVDVEEKEERRAEKRAEGEEEEEKQIEEGIGKDLEEERRSFAAAAGSIATAEAAVARARREVESPLLLLLVLLLELLATAAAADEEEQERRGMVGSLSFWLFC